MEKYCLYCSCKIFEEDRFCVRCGAPTLPENFIEKKIKTSGKSFLVNVAECEGVNLETGIQFFTGRCLISSDYPFDYKYYIGSSSMDFNICDVRIVNENKDILPISLILYLRIETEMENGIKYEMFKMTVFKIIFKHSEKGYLPVKAVQYNHPELGSLYCTVEKISETY